MITPGIYIIEQYYKNQFSCLTARVIGYLYKKMSLYSDDSVCYLRTFDSPKNFLVLLLPETKEIVFMLHESVPNSHSERIKFCKW